jgi:hypothetical protein
MQDESPAAMGAPIPQRSIQDVIGEAKTILANVEAEVGGLVNLPALEGVALTAFTTGGHSAILPALIANVSQYVLNPSDAALVAFALKLAGGLFGFAV